MRALSSSAQGAAWIWRGDAPRSRVFPRKMAELVKVLSIDGGGIRGIIPALLLNEIEERTGVRIWELFDLIAGTSTGGILALLLASPNPDGTSRYSANELVKLYERCGARIFSRSLLHRLTSLGSLREEKYPCAGIESVLEEYFGDIRLRDAFTDVLIPSYEIEQRFPFFFRSSMARKRSDYDFLMRDVARATSAAPTYFEPMKLYSGNTNVYYALIDGGVFANNPAACALVEAITTHPEAEGCLLVSLGTGTLTCSLPYQQAKNWGLAQWAKPVLDIVFDGVSSTVDYQLRQILPPEAGGAPRYYRFQTALDPSRQAMDDASAQNIAALKGVGSKLASERAQDLEELCSVLLQEKVALKKG